MALVYLWTKAKMDSGHLVRETPMGVMDGTKMSEPRRNYRQGLHEGRAQGVNLVVEQLHEYRVLVSAVSEGEQLKAADRQRLLGGVAAIDSMLEITQGISDRLEEHSDLTS